MKLILSEDSHCMTCDKDTCPVCHSKLVEWKAYWNRVWLLVLKTQSNDPEYHSIHEY